jgi:hypothetical protein
MHLSPLEMSLPLWSRRFLLIDRPPVHAFTKFDTCFATRQKNTLSSH